jgi:hypothetical protein
VQADSRPDDDVYHHRMTTHRVSTMLELFDNAEGIRSVCEPMGPQVITLLERNGIVNPAVFRHAVTVDSKRQVFIQQQRVGQTNPAFENMLLTLHDRLAVAAAAPAVKAHHK